MFSRVVLQKKLMKINFSVAQKHVYINCLILSTPLQHGLHYQTASQERTTEQPSFERSDTKF